MPSLERGPHGGKYPHYVVQSILVPKSRSDVRGDPDRARIVAERYGARPGGKIAEQASYFAFRQVNPDKIQDGSYVSFKVPNSGVILRKGLPLSARENPASETNPIWFALGAAAIVFVGAGLLGARNAQAAPAPNPNTPVTPPPARVVRPATPTPTYVRQADGFDPSSDSATRVLQAQLKALGYRIPAVDGIFGPDTTMAVTAFLDANGMSFAATPARDFFTAIDEQYAYFFDPRGGLRTV